MIDKAPQSRRRNRNERSRLLPLRSKAGSLGTMKSWQTPNPHGSLSRATWATCTRTFSSASPPFCATPRQLSDPPNPQFPRVPVFKMAENAPPAGATNAGADAGRGTGTPYYEKLRRDLRDTLTKKRALDQSLVSLVVRTDDSGKLI